MLESFVGRRRRDHLGRRVSELSRSCLGKVSEGSRKGLGAASWLSRIQRLGPRYPRYRLVLPCHLHLRQERWG